MDEPKATDETAIQVSHEENLPIPVYQELAPYQGAASAAFPPEVSKILGEAITDEDHDILPTGEVYVPQVHYRRKLIKAFGHGGWALIPRMPWKIEKGIIFREFALYAGGRYVTEAIGTQAYDPADTTNSRMTYAEATESAKSDALKKMCKDLGIASECWDRRWCEAWKKKFAVLVTYEEVIKGKKTGNKKRAWRRKDASPLPYEIGPVSGGTAAASASAPADPGLGDQPISDPRMKRLFALMKQYGKTEAQVDEYILKEYQIKSKKDIKVSQYDAICKWIETPAEGSAGLPDDEERAD